MDTRNKIIPLDQAALRIAEEGLLPVQIDCDPLLAPVLAKLNQPLLALVTDRPASYLSVEARAELAASLAVVRYVAIGTLPGALDLREQENAARHELEQLVLRKSEVR
ncbi:MAG: hypothetical protein NTW74_09415 [Acidobacteria bacterium]|nr:hypothetical protein [Acidobacteriota bacterium]